MTPLQELIQEMEELKKTKLYPESFKAIDECIHLAWAKLEMEKEKIDNAWDRGYKQGYYDPEFEKENIED